MWLCTCMYEDEFDAICILHSVDRTPLYSYFALRLSALLSCIPVLFIQPILPLSFFHRIQPVWSENSRYSRKDDEQRQSRNSSNVCETPALREVGNQTNKHRKYFNYLESIFRRKQLCFLFLAVHWRFLYFMYKNVAKVFLFSCLDFVVDRQPFLWTGRWILKRN